MVWPHRWRPPCHARNCGSRAGASRQTRCRVGVARAPRRSGIASPHSGGPTVSYQHYRLALRGPLDVAAAAILLVQGVLVAYVTWRERASFASWLNATLSPFARVAFLVALVATSATVSKSMPRYGAELVFSGLIQLAALGSIVIFASRVSRGSLQRAGARLSAWLGDDAVRPSRLFDRFAVPLACWVMIAAVVLAVWSYELHPHVPDEVIYLLQAKYFAHGMLAMPAPPVPAAFDIDIMYYEPHRWFSPAPPAWSAVLALGVLAGVPWLVNPLLGGFNLLLAHKLFSDLYPQRVARFATVLLAFSPWFVFMAMNFMTHSLTLTFALLAAVGVSAVRRSARPRLWVMFGSGLAIGAVSLIRPLEGLAVAIVLGLWSLWSPGKRWRFSPSAVLTAGAVAGGALVFPYNQRLTGSPLVYPIMRYTDTYYGKGTNDLGFGANRGLGWPGLDPFPGHGAIDVVVNANLNTTAINVELLGWATGSLIALFFLLARGRLRRPDWALLGAVFVVVGLHSFYWFSGGPDFGARYWYLVIIPLIVLTARGVDELAASVGDNVDGPRSNWWRPYLGALALSAIALIAFIPWRAVDKYRDYRGMRPDVRRLASSLHFGRSLVLVRGRRHPDYASAAAYNPVDLHADAPIYAWDVSPGDRRQLLSTYADRSVWILDGPSITHAGYRVVAGPVPAQQLLADSASRVNR